MFRASLKKTRGLEWHWKNSSLGQRWNNINLAFGQNIEKEICNYFLCYKIRTNYYSIILGVDSTTVNPCNYGQKTAWVFDRANYFLKTIFWRPIPRLSLGCALSAPPPPLPPPHPLGWKTSHLILHDKKLALSNFQEIVFAAVWNLRAMMMTEQATMCCYSDFCNR